MTPLSRFVVGMALVLIDLRVNGLDLVPDVAGWALVLAGLLPLLGRSGWFQVASAAAVVELLVSVFELTSTDNDLTGFIDTLASPVLIFAVTTGIIGATRSEEVRAAGDPVRWTNLVIGLVTILVVIAYRGRTTLEDGVAFVVVFVLVALAAVIWFLAFCWNRRGLPELR